VTFAVGQDPGDQPDEVPRAVSIHRADDALPGVDHETLSQAKVTGL